MSESTTGTSPEEIAAEIHGAPSGVHEEHSGPDSGGAEAPASGSARQDIFSRLADAGEEVISRVAGLPGTGRALEQAQTALGRLDDLQKRLLGVEALAKRVTELEARVAELESRDERVEAVGFQG